MRDRLAARMPGRFFLDAEDPKSLQRWLSEHGHLQPQEDVLTLSRAGEGNMNLTLRVKTDRRTFILKQARPWVEKYPDIEAPPERIGVEATFYEVTRAAEAVVNRSPGVIFYDAEDRLLAMTDLGEAADFTDIYGPGRIRDTELSELAAYLGELHSTPVGSRPVLQNRKMRALNHKHIFDLPLQPDNGLDLDAFCPGLADAAAPLLQDRTFVDGVHKLGQTYLADGPRLLHGDFYPGSFLRARNGVKVIDPEFAFLGTPEFDLGVLIAHMVFSGEGAATAGSRLLDRYPLPSGFRTPLAFRFAGAELMRRLLGVAQLPLQADLALRSRWLKTSRKLVVDGQP